MKLYRGLKKILASKVDLLYQNTNLNFLDYGLGTSYSYNKALAIDYVLAEYYWGFVYSIEFSPRNPLYIRNNNKINENDDLFHYGIKIHNITINKKELADFARKNDYDCVIFEYDDEDTHILIVDKTIHLDLIEIELFCDNPTILKELIPLNLTVGSEEHLFQVPNYKLQDLEEILLKFI